MENKTNKKRHVVFLTSAVIRDRYLPLLFAKRFPDWKMDWIELPVIRNIPQSMDQFPPCKERYEIAGRLLRIVRNGAFRNQVIKMLRTISTHARRNVTRGFKYSPKMQEAADRTVLGKFIDEMSRSGSQCLKPTYSNFGADLMSFIQELRPQLVILSNNVRFDARAFRSVESTILLVRNGAWWTSDDIAEIETAIYHRDLNRVGSAVFLVDSESNAYLLKTSTACLTENDTLETCVTRSSALGAELVCRIFDELTSVNGNLWLLAKAVRHRAGSELRLDTDDVRHCVSNDVGAGLFSRELTLMRNF